MSQPVMLFGKRAGLVPLRLCAALNPLQKMPEKR